MSQAVECVLRSSASARDWPCALAEAIQALFGFVASEPVAARLRNIAAHAHGAPQAAVLLDEALHRAATTVWHRLGPRQHASPVVEQATCGAIATLLSEQVQGGHTVAFAPTATFVALAQFVGAERADTLARGRAKIR